MDLYFIAIVPPLGLKEKIRAYKEEIREKYHSRHALKLPAHVTLQAPFRMSEKKEPDLFALLEEVGEEYHPFPVELSGFGSFPPRVIFIEIKDHNPLKELHRRLEKKIDEKIGLGEREKMGKFHPHITMATRDLDKQNFRKAWADFKIRTFSDSFTARNFTLLKHNGKNWEVYREIDL